MPEDNTGNSTRPRPAQAPDPENPCTKSASTPTVTPASVPVFFSQPQIHGLEDDDYDHYGDDEQEDDHDGPEHEREREHSPAPTPPSSQQPIQQMPPQQQQQSQPTPAPTPTPGPFVAHVHFHSRVRITSGLRHSRGTHTLGDSSDSDSPSSSISVPLRFRSRDSVPRTPLAERVSRLAAKTLQKRRAAAAVASVSRLRARDDEYAPLFRPTSVPVTYGATRYGHSVNDHANRDNDEPHAEDDVVYGRWPWRALNRRWWKWQIESTLRCCCSDESDSGD